MKIHKKPVVCSTDESDQSVSVKSSTEQAKVHILAAIDALGDAAKDGDIVARESIANLGVVLLDLS